MAIIGVRVRSGCVCASTHSLVCIRSVQNPPAKTHIRTDIFSSHFCGTPSASLAAQVIDKSRCDMKQKCPPNAWKKFEGGLTYKFVEESIKPNLIQMCIDAGAENTEVQFE